MPVTSPPALLERAHAGTKDVGGQVDIGDFESRHELRSDSSWLHTADDLAVLNARLLEREDVLHNDDIPFHSLNFGDSRNLSRAVLEALLLHDQIDRRGDLLADGANRQVHAG